MIKVTWLLAMCSVPFVWIKNKAVSFWENARWRVVRGNTIPEYEINVSTPVVTPDIFAVGNTVIATAGFMLLGTVYFVESAAGPLRALRVQNKNGFFPAGHLITVNVDDPYVRNGYMLADESTKAFQDSMNRTI